MATGILAAELTASRLRELLQYDPETGSFRWYSRKRCPARTAGFVGSKGYIHIRIFGTLYAAHRLAWMYQHGWWPTDQIDHINGTRHDNRFNNLRDVSNTTNQQNQKAARKDNILGIMGVSFSAKQGRKPYRVDIRYGGKQHYLGRFETADEASEVYLTAKRLHQIGNTI